MKRVLGAAAGVYLLVCGCTKDQADGFLGSAVIESKTCTVSAQVAGALLAVTIEEGSRVREGDTVALVDTLPVFFALREVDASIDEVKATVAAKKAEIGVLEAEAAGVKRELERTETLLAKGSATVQQRDNLLTQKQSMERRIDAARSGLVPLDKKAATLEVRRAGLADQMSRCVVKSPVNGTVLTLFRTRGEVAPTGGPVAELGATDTFTADFFVPQPVLSTITAGQQVVIRVDRDGAGTKNGLFIPAIITRIGEEAEFTPKNIQTREGRNELVFRIRCTASDTSRVLKRGLPVEIWSRQA